MKKNSVLQFNPTAVVPDYVTTYKCRGVLVLVGGASKLGASKLGL